MYTGIVVSHTHWDREWYLPFQTFRIKLIETVDTLLDTLKENPAFSSFTLDGQTVILEDYLEIKPFNADIIREYIKNGRIFIGPWYTLPDEFLASGESIIRNLLLGNMISQEFGNRLPIGYMPDIRCQISQMPQILKGANIDVAILGRGVGYVKKSEFLWEGSDGTTIICTYMPRGYSNLGRITEDEEKAIRRVASLTEILTQYATTDVLLFMNGGDHLLPEKNLPSFLNLLNKKFTDICLLQGSLIDYVSRIKEKSHNLEIIRGEFLSNKPVRICPGVWSSRMYLKVKNRDLETLIEKYTEPLATFAWVLGNKYPKNEIIKAWKYLLQNHAHDSISGCGIDEVHREMETRYDWVKQIGEYIRDRSLKYLASKINLEDVQDDVIPIIVFNPNNWERTDIVKAEIILPNRLEGFSIIDCKGELIESHLDNIESMSVGNTTCYKVSFSFIRDQIPPLGYKVFYLKLSSANIKTEKNADIVYEIENEFFKVIADPITGILDVIDKETGITYKGCNKFEDVADAGDEYNFCPLEQDIPITTKVYPEITTTFTKVSSKMEIKYALSIPKEITEDRKRRSSEYIDCSIITEVILYPKVRRIDFKTTVSNLAKDHRLRVLFPDEFHNKSTYWVESKFDVVERKVDLPKAEKETLELGQEVYTPTRPQDDFLSTENLSLINRGLPEYEILKGGKGISIALTLIRAVGWLSRGDLYTRKGNAGPSVPTPDAQCIGEYEFHYSLLPHFGKSWIEAEALKVAKDFTNPLVAIQAEKNRGELPKEFSFIELSPENLLISAVKKAEDSDSLILRIYNPTSNDYESTIKFFKDLKDVRIVNLLEQQEESEYPKLKFEGNKCYFRIDRYKILTLGIRFS